MAKLRLLILALSFLLNNPCAFGQDVYALHLSGVDTDSATLTDQLGVKTRFANRNECVAYVTNLPSVLQARGYVNVSIDSLAFDSLAAHASVYLGEKYVLTTIDTRHVDQYILEAVGWRPSGLENKPINFREVQRWQEKILTWLENNGHPFARVWVDSIRMEGQQLSVAMRMDKGPNYKVDSIRIIGNAKVSNEFLQRYLDIRNGSTFSREKLLRISRRVRELSFVEEEHPSRLIWLGSGSILEMYLRQRKSSQVNILVGFLPNNDQLSSKKLLITGEANLNLKNALGAGETIGLNWQQLQVKSPRLNLLYQHPYIFNSPIGLDFSFDMFRKDSTFLNVNFQIGAQYVLSVHQSGRLFLQRFQTIVNGVNTNYILQNYRLPDEADVSAVNLGIDYEYNNTNYRLNPTTGNEFRIIASAGTKTLKRNNEVLELKDQGNPDFDFATLYDTLKLKTYQFRVRANAARYFPIGRQGRSTFRTAVNAGFFQSGNVFRNELFQIGGYKLLRGFDEESQYLSQFAVGTLEYRYLVGQNSFFYGFVDGGWGRNNSQNYDDTYTYLSSGLGLAFETKVGVFNLAWAVGKRNDIPFNLRQSKIHFGFVNYF